MRHPVCPPVQLLVRQPLVPVDQRLRMRSPLHLAFKQLMDAEVFRVVSARVIPLHHERVSLRWRQDRQLLDRLSWISYDAL